MFNSNRSDYEIYVEELILAETHAYADQFLRPYTSNLDGELINRIEERVGGTNRPKRFTPQILADIAYQFVVPDFKTRGLIEIPNGWSERRGRFILVLSIHLPSGSKLRQVLIGYTNEPGFTTSTIDPDMEFFVNNTFMLKEMRIPTDRGFQNLYTPMNISDVLSDRENRGLRGTGDYYYIMRPTDVYSVLDADDSLKLMENTDDITDTRTALARIPVKSNIGNRLGNRYMANVMTTRQKAYDETHYEYATTDINAKAQDYASAFDGLVSNDIFLSKIANVRGMSDISDNFLFRDLLVVDPDAESRTTPIVIDSINRRHTAEYSNPLDGQEECDRIAAIVGMAVPALMMELGIHSLFIQCHDQGVGMEYDVILANARSLIDRNVDMEPFLDRFKERFIDELIRPITGGDMYSVALEIKCDLFGDIEFNLYWDGSNRGKYVYPCFCNSLATPIVTNNRDDIYKMGRDFNDLFEHFTPTYGRTDYSVDDTFNY